MAFKEQTRKEAMYQRITDHGDNLNKIFHTDKGAVPLCSALRRLEISLTRLTERACNEDYPDFESDTNKLMIKVDNILNYKAQGIPVFLNTDPRGYALKIDDAWLKGKTITLHRDWGGYGIIAPDLTEA